MLTVVYFDKLLGAARTQKLVETFFSALVINKTVSHLTCVVVLSLWVKSNQLQEQVLLDDFDSMLLSSLPFIVSFTFLNIFSLIMEKIWKQMKILKKTTPVFWHNFSEVKIENIS